MRDALLRRLLAVIDNVPRGRAELLELSGIDPADWRSLIVPLCDSGAVVQLGDRKGARYLRGQGSAPAVVGQLAPRPTTSRNASHRPHAADARAERRLADAIDATPRGRAELTERAGIDQSHWLPAISTLLETGAVHRLGDKGGARYFRVADGPGNPPLSGAGHGAEFQSAAHDDLEDLLREFGVLDADSGQIAAISENGLDTPFNLDSGFDPQQNQPRRSKHTGPVGLSLFASLDISATRREPREPAPALQLLPAPMVPPIAVAPARLSDTDRGCQALPRPKDLRGNRPRPLTPLAEQHAPTPAPERPHYLDRREHEMFDCRSSGGCLWIVDTPAARNYITLLNLVGAGFAFAPHGGRATGNRPAWWTKSHDVILLSRELPVLE